MNDLWLPLLLGFSNKFGLSNYYLLYDYDRYLKKYQKYGDDE